MTKLEYGAVPHNSGENRNPMDRDSVGLNITKQALETHPYRGLNQDELGILDTLFKETLR